MSDQTNPHATPPKGWFAGAAVVVGCALACTLPLIAGVGAAASLGAFVTGAAAWTAPFLLTAGVAALLWWRRRRLDAC